MADGDAAGDRLRALERGTTPEVALAFFDELPPVQVAELVGDGLRGSWRGAGLPTQHPFDGVLERLGWHGKRFTGPDRVDPLVFRGRPDGHRERLVCIDPRFLPLGLGLRIARFLRTPVAAGAFALLRPLLATSRPQARLRMLEVHGVVSAAMIYDRQPVIDAFRRVDEDTLLGMMDLRGMPAPFFFVLRREGR